MKTKNFPCAFRDRGLIRHSIECKTSRRMVTQLHNSSRHKNNNNNKNNYNYNDNNNDNKRTKTTTTMTKINNKKNTFAKAV